LVGKVLFLALAFGLLVPFVVRDYRRNRRTLVLEQEGLRLTDGKELFIPWKTVTAILVTEAPIGPGSIIVKG
jgi:hypothetical protein